MMLRRLGVRCRYAAQQVLLILSIWFRVEVDVETRKTISVSTQLRFNIDTTLTSKRRSGWRAKFEK